MVPRGMGWKGEDLEGTIIFPSTLSDQFPHLGPLPLDMLLYTTCCLEQHIIVWMCGTSAEDQHCFWAPHNWDLHLFNSHITVLVHTDHIVK